MRKRKTPKCLVIDADVARAAGKTSSQNLISIGCRNFLDVMLETTKHKVVLTKTIQEEWNKHQSVATLIWRRTMIAQKRVCLIEAPTDEQLRQHIEQHATTENKRSAMLKDIHLVEAALQTDKIVVSMDETVRQCFHEATREVRKLKQIAWVNPGKSEETPLDWLQNGAELERERLLGYSKENAND